MPEVIVKKSKIHGIGVFASRNFKQGQVVIQWDISHELAPEQIKKLKPSDKKYVAIFGGKCILMQPPARYVNHSCDANTTVVNFCDVAKRDIKQGEEVTADYAEDETPGLEMACTCKSKNCRKLIKRAS